MVKHYTFSVQVTFYLLNKFGQNTKISYITIRASEADIPPCMPPTPSKKKFLHSAPTNVGDSFYLKAYFSKKYTYKPNAFTEAT